MSENKPEWLTVGADVAAYHEGRGATGRPGYRKVTVERFTRTQVIASGVRYRLEGLGEMAAGSYYGAPRLIPLNDPRVAKVDDADRVSSLRHKALCAVDGWRIGAGGSPDLARAAAVALLAYADGVEPMASTENDEGK